MTVAIRPEKIQLSRDRPPGTDNVLAGAVVGIAYLGDATRYLVQLPNGFQLRVTAPNVSRREERFDHGDPVWMHWHASSPVVVTR
ncbi:MAG: TOBE domain-containing protein [Deltaproteobacteria bacterium]